MNSTGDSMDARQARDALAAACAARTAARRASEANERTRPRGYDIGQGLTFAAAFTALGLSDLMPRYGTWLALTGLAFAAAFFALIWTGAHHGGVARWFSRDGGPRRGAWDLWVAPLVCLAIGALAAIPYGGPGWLIAYGLATGAERVLRAFRRQGGTA
ncbi:hypothetical protein BFF78_20665 [Streptomyces fodineus]|uniref:Uncharacterized protein n=1 Tax=Streptomyces fodineus TaxID=1904616 RepID=A0A1D7YC11_9ACTN|nr:hypothetical protein [Streptomyces fodineus]AOR33155.1 hypothetical protein BFF78_20665 [Streptomyces fodineus]